MNIYVGNLPFSATEDDLKEVFSSFGTVVSAKVIMDRETGRSRGFGFVELGDNSARKAISELNGAEYDGKVLTVNEAREKKPNNRFNRGGHRAW